MKTRKNQIYNTDTIVSKIRRAVYLFWMPIKNDVLFKVGSLEKDMIFGGKNPALPILLEL